MYAMVLTLSQPTALTRKLITSRIGHTLQWLSDCLLQPEQLANLTVEASRQAFALMFIHPHPPVEPHTDELRYLRQQLRRRPPLAG